jgi:hypothetical protein
VTNEQVRLHQIFELVTAEVDSACGDGDGVVVFRKTNVQEVATEFEVCAAAGEASGQVHEPGAIMAVEARPGDVLRAGAHGLDRHGRGAARVGHGGWRVRLGT